MKQNITLSLDRELILQGKVIAAQRGTSLNRMLSDELARIIRKAQRYDQARKKAIANLHAEFHWEGTINASREELHER